MSRLTIIQIVVTPDNSTYQGRMLGLGSDGNVYYAESDNLWHEWFPNRFYIPEKKEGEK